MIRAGLVALSALTLAACGGEPAADQGDPATNTNTNTESVVAVAKTGEDLFKKCVACHTVDAGGRNGIGPNLHAIVGASVAAREGYNYSSALKARGGVWDEAALDAYIASPTNAVPGNKMMFAGINDAAERKALIDYLAAQK